MKHPFVARWRIVWMSQWDQDYVDSEAPGHITIGAGHSGEFQFGLVQAQIDSRVDRTGGGRLEFTWQGFDEGDELAGRGRAEIVGGELHGHLYVHQGDDSAFRAIRQESPAICSQRRRRGQER